MDFSLLIPILVEWWPFLLMIVIFWVVGEQVKKNAPGPNVSKFWNIYHRTLTLHPIISGVLLGLIPGIPLPVAVAAIGDLAGALFYGGSGAMSVISYDIFKTWIKHKIKSIDKE
jgi:hypothetical protein